MIYNSKAVIVWIDDHFLTQTFEEDQNKSAWHKLFGKINSNLYRLLDINIKFIRTAQEAEIFLEQTDLFKANTYYYFIVDRKLPFIYGQDAVDSNSEDIINDLIEYKKLYKCLDFSVLSSGSPDSYAIKNIDYYLKPQNKEFSLPEELRHKILLNIKNSIGFIDQTVTYQQNKIYNYGDKEELSTNDIMLYPFIDKFRSFVELEEIIKNDFETLIVLASDSTSDKFIQQSLLIALNDNLKDYEGLNYYKDATYEGLKSKPYYDEISDLTDKIPIIRLEKWDLESFTKINKLLKHRLCIFIINNEDDNISNYIDSSKKTRIIKIEGLDRTNKESSEIILFSLINKLTNEFSLNLDKSIYGANPILFFHPISYRLIADAHVHIPKLDDPSETIFEIFNYFKELNLNNQITQQKIIDSLPIELNTVYIYKRCKLLLGDNYNLFMKNTIQFWLKNSWNVNYNINASSYDSQAQWKEYSYTILKELLSKISIEELDEVDKDDFTQIINAIELFENMLKESNDNNKMSYKMIWPHEKYPILFYMQEQLSSKNNQKLYFQNTNFNFVDYAPELLKYYKLLENKINYYKDIFDLINKTIKYFPNSVQGTITKIANRIQNSQVAFQKNENEEFKILANVILRIPIIFGESVLNKSIDFKESDKAGLGVLAGIYRDQIINKKNHNLFKTKYLNVICDNVNREMEFIQKYGTILNNKDTVYKALLENSISIYDKNNKLSNFKVSDDDEDEYVNRLLRADNLDLVSQLSTLSSSMLSNEHDLKIIKYKDCYKLLAYLADTRNMWEHKHNELWNNELFVRFFIYSFESLWLMQKYILEKLNQKNLPETKYIELNFESKDTNIRFKDINEYENYFNKLYSNNDEKND